MSYRVFAVPNMMNYVEYDSLNECSVPLCEVITPAADSLQCFEIVPDHH